MQVGSRFNAVSIEHSTEKGFAVPGPAPKANARRRNTETFTRLPALGREGDAPKWPLPGKAPAVWPELWATPQAAAWETMGAGVVRLVARYASMLSQATNPAFSAECRMIEDRLGLSPMAMARLKWVIAGDELAAAKASPESAPSSAPRRRLVVAE